MAEPLTRPLRLPRTQAAGLFAACWAGLLVLLLVRNRQLFTLVIYEGDDFAANSILTYQAKHFMLLHGHYSHIPFWHPGPAFFYVQAAGEWFLHDLTGIAPAPYNGQVMAIMALNATLIALTLTILYSWLRSAAAVLTAAGVTLAFLAGHQPLVSSSWIPYACLAPFLLYLFAVASVAAGRLRHLWIMVLAGGLLVHGYAQFLFLVPLLALVALVPQRRQLLAHRRDVLVASGVLAVFLLPIVLNEILHWPGEIPKYLAYGHQRAPNSPVDAARYLVQFWVPAPSFWHPGPAIGAVFLVVLFAGDVVLTRALAARGLGDGLSDLSRHLLRVTGVATALFLVYCWYGVDDLSQPHIGTFSYALPLALLILGTSALVLPLRPGRVLWARPLRAGVAVLSLAVGLVLAGTTPALVSPNPGLEGVPAALDYLVVRAHGRPIVLATTAGPATFDTFALVVTATRHRLRACMAQERWRMVVTAEFICTPQELAGGARFVVSQVDPAPPGTPVMRNSKPTLWATIIPSG
jgi:hypothetical protein